MMGTIKSSIFNIIFIPFGSERVLKPFFSLMWNNFIYLQQRIETQERSTNEQSQAELKKLQVSTIALAKIN